MKRDVTQESEDRGSPPPIPHHQLLRRIGRGSYGEVWIALDAMGKWCAVKIVWRDDADSGRAYEQEFRGLKRYDDLVGNEAHLMPIRNVGRDPGGAYFYYAMELADDATTRQPLPRPRSQDALAPEILAMVRRYRPWTLTEQLRQEGRLPQAECVEYGLALSSALEVIHGGRLVHRDVKPSNIIFVNGRPKLADVGLVTAIDATMLSQVGTSGFVPLYGAGTESGDLFALGKVIYLMATGKAIYEFPAEAADLGQLGEQERHALAELRAVYDRACDVMPDDRYESARALRDDLDLLRRNESVIHLRELQDSEGRLLQQARKQQRRLRLLALATIASVLFSVVAWWWVGLNTRIARQAVLAELEVRQLLRMRDRKEGWAQEDWNRVLRAASLGLDDEDVWRHAVATLSGLEAHQIGYWKNVEATSAAFAEDGCIVLAGHGQNAGAVINGLTNRSPLPVRGEGKVAWTRTGAAWLLQAEAHACVVRDAFSGGCDSIPAAAARRIGQGPRWARAGPEPRWRTGVRLPDHRGAIGPDGALAGRGWRGAGRACRRGQRSRLFSRRNLIWPPAMTAARSRSSRLHCWRSKPPWDREVRQTRSRPWPSDAVPGCLVRQHQRLNPGCWPPRIQEFESPCGIWPAGFLSRFASVRPGAFSRSPFIRMARSWPRPGATGSRCGMRLRARRNSISTGRAAATRGRWPSTVRGRSW